MNYLDGIEVHLHDIVKINNVNFDVFDGRGFKMPIAIPDDTLAEVIDVFPENRRCFLVSLLEESKRQFRLAIRQVQLADYRDIATY